MVCVCRAAAFVGVVFYVSAAGSLLAHDFGSGPRMGFPPNGNQTEQRLLRLIPAGLDEPTVAALRGVIDRVKMWRQEQVLIVCFLSGSRKARARVAAIAVEWTNYVNLRLNFGDMQSPRTCSGTGSEHIKIDFLKFGPDAGHWSYVGVDSWQFAHSMNLQAFGDDALPVGVTLSDYRGVVLHEFGHALGLAHEHQSPDAKCDAEFNPQQVDDWAARMGWSQADVKTNLARLEETPSLEFTRHDKRSIMHYSLPPELFPDGKSNRCWVPKNNELSEGDKKFAASIYSPRLAGDGSQGVRMGEKQAMPIDPQKIEVEYRAALQRSFAQNLAKGGVESSAAEALTTRFQNEIGKLRSGPPKNAN